MNHTNNAIAEIVKRLEVWFDQHQPPGALSTDFIDVTLVFASTSGLWGYVSSPTQISQALLKLGSPKLHTNDDGSQIRKGTFEEVVKCQIEYYFGDKNYHKDSFLQTFKNPNGGNHDGYVPIVELLRFAKMKRITSTCPNVDLVKLVANVLSESDVAAVHSDRIHVRRLAPEERVIKKVENFFKDSHLPNDTYVPISTISTLPKLQKCDYDFIERTLQNAPSNIFELSNDRSSVRKKTSYKGALMFHDRSSSSSNSSVGDSIVEPLPVQVRKYVEYLFGDVNFPKDAYLQKLASQNEGGFVPLHELMNFPRMAKLCQDPRSVFDWLQQSDLVEFSEDVKFIRKKKPPLELRKMVFAKQFLNAPLDVDEKLSFTVMSYNVLADFLTTNFQFPYTTPETRNWDTRKKDILKEILLYRPDVVCLQEIQTVYRRPDEPQEIEGTHENDHLSFFVENMRGYDFLYKRKTRFNAPQQPGPDIGNAIFYNKEKFTLVSKCAVEYERVLWKESKRDKSARTMLACGHPQVAVFGYLSHILSGKCVLIATTHICSDWKSPYIQLRQVRACLSELRKYNKQQAPIILAGDFNTQPETPVYQFLSQGQISKHMYNTLKVSPKFEFKQDLGLASAYAKVLGHEPSCTNVTHEFEGTLDYLWYSKRSLRPVSILDIPTKDILKEETGLPSTKFPSDHLPLLCKFKFHN